MVKSPSPSCGAATHPFDDFAFALAVSGIDLAMIDESIAHRRHMAFCDGRLGVIFGLDGVLVDTGWAHRQAV
jgi:hypothetical protein